jgi:VWFA-related protein
MRRTVTLAAAALWTVVVFGRNGFVAAAQETPTFKAGVALVKVDAEVTDGARLLGGFQKDDFRILDNETDQPILYFSQGEEPLDIILLFDLSGSMIPRLKKLSQSAHAALAELHNGDRVSVMVFGSKSRVVLPFTDDLNAVERTINGITAIRMGGTHIVAAINDAAMLFMKEQRTRRRRAIITVTDNFGQFSGNKRTTVRNLWEADAVLCGLQIRSPGETALLMYARVDPLSAPMTWMRSGESMSSMPEKTGGEVLRGNASVQFTELMHRLRLRYTLYYAMPHGGPGEERHIQVTLSKEATNRNPRGRVFARKGYHLPEAQ